MIYAVTIMDFGYQIIGLFDTLGKAKAKLYEVMDNYNDVRIEEYETFNSI